MDDWYDPKLRLEFPYSSPYFQHSNMPLSGFETAFLTGSGIHLQIHER